MCQDMYVSRYICVRMCKCFTHDYTSKWNFSWSIPNIIVDKHTLKCETLKYTRVCLRSIIVDTQVCIKQLGRKSYFIRTTRLACINLSNKIKVNYVLTNLKNSKCSKAFEKQKNILLKQKKWNSYLIRHFR